MNDKSEAAPRVEWLDRHPEERESIRSKLSSIAKELQKEHGLSADQIRQILQEILSVTI